MAWVTPSIDCSGDIATIGDNLLTKCVGYLTSFRESDTAIPLTKARTDLTNDIFILVVEDETLIEEIAVSGLEDAGYTVVAAHTAEEAIAQLEKGDPVVRAIVTDVNLAPKKLTGWDVARRARERTADIPIVYMSGASGHDWTSHGVPNSVLIAKPFAIGQIVTAVSQLLNASGPAVVE